MAEIDWSIVVARMWSQRLAFETLALVLASGLVGFLIARSLYKGQVTQRSEILRRASASWRRRLSLEQRASSEISRDRDRANRERRMLKRSATAEKA